MSESTTFRCYYDDGTVLISDFCPNVNANNSPLIASELTIIEDVTGQMGWPWLLLILAMVVLTSKKGR